MVNRQINTFSRQQLYQGSHSLAGVLNIHDAILVNIGELGTRQDTAKYLAGIVARMNQYAISIGHWSYGEVSPKLFIASMVKQVPSVRYAAFAARVVFPRQFERIALVFQHAPVVMHQQDALRVLVCHDCSVQYYIHAAKMQLHRIVLKDLTGYAAL